MRRTVRRVAILTALTTSAVALSVGAASAQDAEVPEPSSFTSMFTAMATPDMVINADGVATPGRPAPPGPSTTGSTATTRSSATTSCCGA